MTFWSEKKSRQFGSALGSDANGNGSNPYQWVRPPFQLALFIFSVWFLSMVPIFEQVITLWEQSLGRLVLITAVVISFYGLFVIRNEPVVRSLSGTTVYAGLLIGTLALGGVSLHMQEATFFVPLTLFTMLLAIGFSTIMAIESYFFMLALITVAWIPSGGTFETDFSFLLTAGAMAPGSFIAAYLCSSIRTRTRPLSAGIAAGGIHVLITSALVLLFFRVDPFPGNTFVSPGHFLFVFGNGVLSGVLLLVILPAIEKMFGIPTDLGLLELTDMNRPALRDLAMEAPGTYHHSLRVGTLCEEAAEKIGANRLMARVGSYYHDIGKTTKPQYFIENTHGGENPHDRLPSNMSKLILLSHVRDGLELADQYGLPEWIKDFIEQHHGTSVTEYFFAKQIREKIEQGEEPEVETADFRYPGPLPQTREVGICMLADSVEATSRSLDEPSPTQIEGMVERIVFNRLEDGQLDHSGLTMGEIKQIKRTFVEVLSGMLHTRVKYPDQEPEEETKEVLSGIPGSEAHAERARTEGGTGSTAAQPDEASDLPSPRQTFVLDQQNDLDVPEEEIRELVDFVMDAERSDRDVSIVLLKKAEIRDLNRQYLREDRPTDVLSFPLDHTGEGEDLDNLLGEVMVCPALARSRAADHGHSPLHETYLYIIHGLLHLLGYDDKEEADRQRMKTRQNELLEAFTGQKELETEEV